MTDLNLIPQSQLEHDGTRYALTLPVNGGAKQLWVAGNTGGFVGEIIDDDTMLCSLTSENAATLRQRLPWLRPIPLGNRISAGFGDRLGCATVGHLMAVDGTGVVPILAQQSVRENTRTGRTPQQVMDDAMWGVFQYGWRDEWGADADHLKELTDIPPFVDAGYTFYTIDPGDHVDDDADTDTQDTLLQKASQLDWTALDSSLDDLTTRLSGTVQLEGLTLSITEDALIRAAVKYGAAVVHTVKMAARLHDLHGNRPFDLEMSVDETGTTTSHIEHFYIASELTRLGVAFVSLAPRFVGRFEKGVDYIGSLEELDRDIAGHAAIMRHFDNRYKLSLHTGSDKFGVYPIAMKHTSGHVHLKTAGTSYLEALRVMAVVDPALFRRVLDFARERYEDDRKTYHVSAVLDKVAASGDLGDEALSALLNQFDARQVLHVTFGSVLDTFGSELEQMLQTHTAAYHDGLKRHFDRHLEAFHTE
jgi:hypothetical protein